MKNSVLFFIALLISYGGYADTDTRLHALESRVNELHHPLTITGFGTVGGGIASNDSGYRGYSSNQFDPISDSMIAVQSKYRVNGDTSVVLQVTSEAQFDWETTLEWAYLSTKFDRFTVRAGKIRTPLYMYSSTLNVGYSYLMISPPVAIYRTLLVPDFTGIDVLIPIDYRYGEIVINPLYGRSKLSTRVIHDSIGEIDLDNFTGVNIEMGVKDFTYRISGITYEYNTPVKALGLDDDRGTFLSFGVSYDDGTIFALAEMAGGSDTGNAPDSISGAVTMGYTIDKYTPYFTLSRGFTTDNEERADTQWEFLNYETSSILIGVRHDPSPGIAIKLEVEYVDFHETSGGYFSNTIKGPRSVSTGVPIDPDAVTLAISVDYVF